MRLSESLFSEKQSNSDRIYSVDFLRGIAALLVCLFHFTQGNTGYLATENWLKKIGSIGWSGIEIFFILSGFIIPYSLHQSKYHYKDFKNFMLKRILRIEPPYLAAIIFVIGVNYLGTLSPYSKGGDFHINYFNLFLHFGYLNSLFNQGWLNPVFWTLAIEFQFYLLMGLIYPLINIPKKYIQAVILISLLISTYLIKASGLIFHFLPYFILGIILYYRKTKQWSAILCTFAELLIITIIWYSFSRVEFFATIFTWLILLFLKSSKKDLFTWLGKISYSFYLIHVPVGGKIINFSVNFIESSGWRIAVIFFALFTSLFLSYIFYRLIELPAINLSHLIIKKNKSSLNG